MSIPIYASKAPKLEKTAAQKLLSNDLNGWSNEILAALYSKHPYLGSYQVDIQINAQDDEAKYMYGYFLVTQRAVPPDMDPSQAMNRPGVTGTEQASLQGEQPSIRIPILVEAQSLYPLDVFITAGGQFLPLNERRASKELQNQVSVEPHSVQGYGLLYPSMTQEFMPPMRSGGPNYNMQTKTGSLLEAIVGADPTAKAKLASALNTPEGLFLLDNNSVFRGSISKVASVEAAALVSEIENSQSVLIVKTAGATPKYTGIYFGETGFNEVELQLNKVAELGSDAVAKLNRDGYLFYVEDGSAEDSDAAEYTVAKVAGRYSVVLSSGEQSFGYVVPTVCDLSGRELDLDLFISEKGAAFQVEKVGGHYLDNLVPEYVATMSSDRGVFAKVSDNGIEAATTPVKIAHKITNQNGDVTLVTSNGMRIKIAEHILRPMAVPGGYAVPADWDYIPMQSGLSAKPPELAKTASFGMFYDNKFEIIADGNSYHLRGRCGIDKLAAKNKTNLSKAKVAVLLGAVGLNEPTVMQKLAELSEKGSCQVIGNRHVHDTPKKTAALKTASVKSNNLFDMIKVAGQLATPTSIDAVLSTGLLTPENLGVFLNSLPVLEQCVSECARLVISARLGAADIREEAATKAMNGLEDTIRGLETLQVNLSDEQEQMQGV